MLKAIGIMLVIGLILGALLGIASVLFRVEADERVEDVTAFLPGYNCGGCGYSGCAAFAEALCKGKTDNLYQCRPSKPENRQAIAEYLATTPDPDGKTIELKP